MSYILKEYPRFLANNNSFQLAQDLLNFFDELQLQKTQLPATAEEMQNFLKGIYAVKDDYSYLSFQADIVITLWQAWQSELEQSHLIDETQLYIEQLQTHISHCQSDHHWFIYLPEEISAIEQQWLNKLSNQAYVTLFRSNPKTSTSRNLFIRNALDKDNIFTTLPDLDTAKYFGIKEILCSSFENEAMQVASALLHTQASKQPDETITLICEDRNFIRRIRALLEPYPIALIDTFGWSLITTRAATFIQAILNCVENDFYYKDLLELIKSPFLNNLISSENVYRLEQDIIQHENVTSGIDNYLYHLDSRYQRLGIWTEEQKNAIQHALDEIHNATSTLQQFTNAKSFAAQDFIQAILKTIEALQALNYLQEDAAGKVLLNMLNSMLIIAKTDNYLLKYNELKLWLNFELNNQFLIEDSKDSQIQLLSLKQCYGLKTDYLIFANATLNNLPKIQKQTHFFNQSIKNELKLKTHQQMLDAQKQIFINLIARSKETLFTWQEKNQDTENLASPWLSALDNYHLKLFNSKLPNVKLTNKHSAVVPNNKPNNENVSHYTDLLPNKISVSDHQTFIDCPYAFFVNRVLKLKASDEVKEKLEKNDFGSLVHKTLQAFHFDIDKLPGPFQQKITTQNREQAITMLIEISNKIFSALPKNSYQDQVWLKQWRKIIPAFIDWEIQQSEWQPSQGETKFEFTVGDNTTLRGTIDRIDKCNEPKQRILDYKTGKPPNKKDIENGEDVQLALYSLNKNEISEASYIALNKDMKGSQMIAENELEEIKTQTADRLNNIQKRLNAGEAIPIWPNNEKCRLCTKANLCRSNREF